MLCTFLRCFFFKLKFFFVNTFNCKRPVFNLLLWVLMHCISLHPIKVTVWMVQCCTVKCLQSSFFFFHWPHIAERLQSENKEWYCHLVEDWLTCCSPLIHPKHHLHRQRAVHTLAEHFIRYPSTGLDPLWSLELPQFFMTEIQECAGNIPHRFWFMLRWWHHTADPWSESFVPPNPKVALLNWTLVTVKHSKVWHFWPENCCSLNIFSFFFLSAKIRLCGENRCRPAVPEILLVTDYCTTLCSWIVQCFWLSVVKEYMNVYSFTQLQFVSFSLLDRTLWGCGLG